MDFVRRVVEQKSSSLDPFEQVEAEKPRFNMVRACVRTCKTLWSIHESTAIEQAIAHLQRRPYLCNPCSTVVLSVSLSGS